jgi:hypothetical protein
MEMRTHLVWEGVTRKENCRVIQFVGEELGDHTVYYDEFETRGVTFRVFRTADGEILIHKCQWEYPPVTLERWERERDLVPTTEEHWALVYVFSSVERAAEAGFHSVLERLNLI